MSLIPTSGWRRRSRAFGVALTLTASLAAAGFLPAPARSQGLIGLRHDAPQNPNGPVYARAPQLLNAPSRADLNFAVSGPVMPTSFVLAAPDRIVVDLPHVMFAAPTSDVSRAAPRSRPTEPRLAGLVTAYRFGLFEPGKSRIVIELASPARVTRIAVVSDRSGAHLQISLAKTDRASFAAAAARVAMAAFAAPAPIETPAATADAGLPVIVVDPGHGGIDSGAMVHGLIEKNIVFAFAKELAKKLEASGHYKVIMTRDSDVFIALGQRVQIARNAGASLFVSIHADTLADASGVSGVTVYTCSEHASDAAAARTAEKENQSDAVAGVESKDADDGVSDILFDLTRRETQTYSRVFARTLVNYWQVASRLNKNPERYAGFRVLKAPDVPSVLIELGYLSNVSDGAALTSPHWRDTTTTRVVAAIDAFFTEKGLLPEKSATAQSQAPGLDVQPTAATR